jgi:hypothetical protein
MYFDGIAKEKIEIGDLVRTEIDAEIGSSFVFKLDKPKTEREKVCDEILDFLRGRVIERGQAHYFIADLLSKIREIRNRK